MRSATRELIALPWPPPNPPNGDGDGDTGSGQDEAKHPCPNGLQEMNCYGKRDDTEEQ